MLFKTPSRGGEKTLEQFNKVLAFTAVERAIGL